ncbi:MAG: aminotransferase class V-fold PLP-dependent enzyme [candidate division KSB1 bacterium]|nr:aminotransferase class V-fold PLP-dependent enzyme [candidate division KSB1 bacterium]MDZ7319257.1 aminotransferase class V-fold PLP-dependent enzyme [candidate division KSB1 bacterium]MDZ7341135.1 aminotransferase class V-fold PLP-dependent enzyme [candidate division KSB1 bacterium]
MSGHYRSLFEFNPELIYFNHASTGLLPRRSALAMTEYIEALSAAGEPSMDGLLALQAEFRLQASRLLNVPPESIAFIRNTSDGLTVALHSIPWQAGDNMVVQADAFPASLYLAAYCFPKVEKRYVPLDGGHNIYGRLQQAMDDRTRAIVIDYVHFLSGYRFDLARLSNLKKNGNVYLIVDGIQGLGAVQVDLNETAVDFFTAGGVKWLLGPSGTGILYVRQEILEELVPFHIGWASAEYENLDSLYPVRPLIANARRFQPVNDNFIGMVGLTESIRLLHELQPDWIESQIMALTQRAISTFQAHGFLVLTPSENSLRAGIVTFKHPRVASKLLFEQLQQHHIICSLREGWLRLAFHFYNTEEEFDNAFAVIQSTIQTN